MAVKTVDMRYETTESLDQAVALLARREGQARVLAGGTDLLVQLRTDVIEPELLVDIKGIPEMRRSRRKAAASGSAPPYGRRAQGAPRLKAVGPAWSRPPS